MNKTEKLLRQFLRSNCDVTSTIEPDLKLVCQGGKFTFAHKFVLFAFLPELKKLFCNFCLEGHDTTTIFIPAVTVEDVIQARDFLYMFGEKESFAKLFDMKRDSSIKAGNKEKESFARKKFIVSPEPKKSVKPNRKKISLKKKELKEKVSLKNAINLIETRNLTSCSITTINTSEVYESDETAGRDEMRDSLKDNANVILKSEPLNDPMASKEKHHDESERLNIVLADDEELIGEEVEVLKTEEINEGLLSHEEFPYEIQKMDFSEASTKTVEYLCDKCSFKTKNRAVFKTHQGNHSSTEKTKPVLDEKLNCKACGKYYDQASSLRIHVDMEHLGIRYPCDYCEYLGSQVKTIKKHIDSYHPGSNNRYKDIKT